jgi:hypothetical protein
MSIVGVGDGEQHDDEHRVVIGEVQDGRCPSPLAPQRGR